MSVSIYFSFCIYLCNIYINIAIDQYPYFRVFRRGDAEGFDVPHAQVNPITILQRMGIAVDEITENDDMWYETKTYSSSLYEWGRLAWQRYVSGSKADLGERFNAKRSRDDLRDDVHLSFDYAMRHGVFLSDDPLPTLRAETLFSWLQLLRKTLPLSWTSLHAAVQSLIDNFDYVKRSESYMITILEEFPPTKEVWSVSCSHGEADTGYTCGLWELFHVITVGVVDYNRAAAFHRNRLSTEHVARTIRSYVDSFFACEICRQNFVTTFDSCALQRCDMLQLDISEKESDWIQLPLWLLDTHNEVNVRLMKEKAARENRLSDINDSDEIAATWPPSRHCPRCWLPDGKKNTEMMYKYLKLEYGQRDDLYSDYKKDLFVSDVVVELPDSKETTLYYSQLWEILSQIVSLIASSVSAKRQPALMLSLEDRRSDLHLFFITAMQMEIFPNGNQLSDRRKVVLRDWLELLRKTLPATWYEFHSIIQELLDNFSYVSKSKDYLLALLSEYSPSNNDQKLPWSVTFGENSETGYICNLFEMFHVITVGVVHYNKFTAVSDHERLATSKVASIIRTYVNQFVDSFDARLEIIKSMDHVCFNNACDKLLEIPGAELDWVYLPIWMFQVHDAVSRALVFPHVSKKEGESDTTGERLHHWPSGRNCQGCWIDRENWDPDTVYKYLLLHYGQAGSWTIGIYDGDSFDQGTRAPMVNQEL
jgi:Erv1 / Alr family